MKDKKVIVVGGTGSLGRSLIRELLMRGTARVKVFARNEFQMISLIAEFPQTNVEAVIGDVRDRSALMRACAGCDTLFHLAALKHVSICEKEPIEAFETNVFGTRNVIDCALDTGIKKVMYVSTDKAINTNCTYGCTKLLGEKLVLSANSRQSETALIIFRSGNLLGSTGSVIPLFRKQIEENGAVSITDERMNRFFIPIDRAARLLVDAVGLGAGGEIFLPVMPSLLIKDIAKYMLSQKGLSGNAVNIVGARPGEKLSEQMLAEDELCSLQKLNDEIFIIRSTERKAPNGDNAANSSIEYLYRSEKAVLSYDQAERFLRAANI